MEISNEVLSPAPECEIATTHIFQCPVEKLYRAWSDPDMLKNWWGPAGFTNTFHTFDLRPGGRWSFIMHGPKNDDYPNECIFVKVVPNEHLVWNHLPKPKFQVSAYFDKISDTKSKVTFKLVFDTVEECRKIKAFAIEKNEENMDKLEALLKQQ